MKIKEFFYDIWILMLGVFWFMAVIAVIALAYALCGGLSISKFIEGAK